MPLRAMPKLLFRPFTTFQLKSLIQPMCGVMRISRPAPNWPIGTVVAPKCSVVATGRTMKSSPDVVS